MIFDDTPCTLGEGALWHPDRQSLIWFDIIGRRMFEKPMDGARRHWDFADPVSAAGIVDADRIIVLTRGELIASGTPAEVRADAQVQEVYLGSGAMFGHGPEGSP